MKTLKLKTNLRCGACVESIRPLLDAAPGVARWSADVTSPEKPLTVEGDGVSPGQVDGLLRQKGYQVLGELPTAAPPPPPPADAPRQSYFPLLLILGYILGATGLAEAASGAFNGMRAMSHFMAGFFLEFSFFKMLNLTAFADAYAGYDTTASAGTRRWGTSPRRSSSLPYVLNCAPVFRGAFQPGSVFDPAAPPPVSGGWSKLLLHELASMFE